MSELKFTAKFSKEYPKLCAGNPTLKKAVFNKLGLLSENPNHPSLRLHRVEGTSLWSLSVNKSIRILVYFQGSDVFIYHVGKHEDVY